jgi:hypothetical protein
MVLMMTSWLVSGRPRECVRFFVRGAFCRPVADVYPVPF